MSFLAFQNQSSYLLAGVAGILFLLLGCAPVEKAELPSIERFAPAPFSAPNAAAGETGPKPTEAPGALTLRSAVWIALDRNPIVRAAQEGVVAAREAAGEARAPYYPRLDANARYARWQSRIFLPTGVARPGVPTIVGPTDDWSAALTARYTLFDAGERRARLMAALHRTGVAQREAEATRQDIALNVHNAYFGLLSALEGENVARENLGRAEDHLAIAQQRREAGAVPSADVVRARVEVADARLSLTRARSSVRTARGNLNAAMGLPVEMEWKVEPEPADPLPPDRIDLAQSLQAALHNRPSLAAGLEQLGVARADVEAARSAYGPTLSADGSLGRRDADLLPEDTEWSLGLTLSWPIFTGFARSHRLARTRAELSAEESTLRARALQVQREVWSAYHTLVETHESAEAARALVGEAEESVRLSRERYEVGAGTINDLLDAQLALARAKVQLTAAHWDYRQAYSSFRRSTGTLLAE